VIRRPTLLVAGLAALLASCAGPTNTRPFAPLPPAPGAGAPLAPATGTGLASQAFVVGQTTPRAWWEQFGCGDLNRLVTAALAANDDLAAADAALRSARALAGVAGAGLGPAIDAGYTAQRARTAASLSAPVADGNQLLYSLHTAQVTASYPLDLFGGLHARYRSAQAGARAARYRVLAARQTVAGNVVLAAIARAQLADQIAATRTMITSAREVLELTRRRRDLGAAGDADVAAQEAALAALEAGLPALERGEAHQHAVLSILLGLTPGSALPPLPGSSCLALPSRMPVAYSADVVRYRPDVMAAAAAVEGAAADARAALAARFPSITLSATGGGTAQQFSEMFQSANLFWSLIGGITAPVFHSGALRRQQQAAQASLDQAQAQYRGIVLQAFADVSDALHGLHDDALALSAAQRALTAAERSHQFIRRQQELGATGTFAVLADQTTLEQARIQFITAKAARLVDSVALYQANGAAPDE